MQRTGWIIAPQTLLLFLALILTGWGIAPSLAFADTISSQTAQVIPPGGTGCPQITASNFTPYVYNGALNSFDFTVSDASYVAVVGSVGGKGLPFYVMSRWGAPAGALKMHVDIETTHITGTLPITVTLLSAHGAGQPVCMTTVSMSIGSGPVQTTGTSPSAPAAPVSGTYTPPKTSSTPSKTSPTTETPGTSASAATSATSAAASTGVAASMSSIGNALQKACATPLAAERTWLMLLLVYLLIVGIALWAEFPMSIPAMRTPERVAAIILVLLLLLLGFWYFSASCRTALWMPLVAVLIAVLGLLAAFRNHPRLTKIFLLQEETTV